MIGQTPTELEPTRRDTEYRPLEAHDGSTQEAGATGVPSFSISLEVYAPIILAVFLLGGATIYTILEKWSFLDSIYFCSVSLSTVGYGHIKPNTDVMKIFTIIYIYVGIAFVASTVGQVLGRTVGRGVIKQKVNSIAATGWIARCKRSLSYNQLELLRSLLIIISLSTLGTVFFAINENMSIINALYFAMVTLASVGYGDLYVVKTSSKIFNIFFVIIGVTLIGTALFKFADVWARVEQRKWITKFLRRGVTKEVIQAIDVDKNGVIERHEFLAYMLVHLERVNASDIEQINELFYRLDRDGSGSLDLNDLKIARNSLRSIAEIMPVSSND